MSQKNTESVTVLLDELESWLKVTLPDEIGNISKLIVEGRSQWPYPQGAGSTPKDFRKLGHLTHFTLSDCGGVSANALADLLNLLPKLECLCLEGVIGLKSGKKTPLSNEKIPKKLRISSAGGPLPLFEELSVLGLRVDEVTLGPSPFIWSNVVEGTVHAFGPYLKYLRLDEVPDDVTISRTQLSCDALYELEFKIPAYPLKDNVLRLISSITSNNIKKIIIRCSTFDCRMSLDSWRPLDDVLAQLVERLVYNNHKLEIVFPVEWESWSQLEGRGKPHLPKFIQKGHLVTRLSVRGSVAMSQTNGDHKSVTLLGGLQSWPEGTSSEDFGNISELILVGSWQWPYRGANDIPSKILSQLSQLTSLILSGCCISVSQLVAFLDRLPKLECLCLEGVTGFKSDERTLLSSRNIPKKLHINKIKKRPKDSLIALNELQKKDLIYEVASPPSLAWKEVTDCAVSIFGASLKRLRLPMIPRHTPRLQLSETLSSCRELEEFEFEIAAWPLFPSELDLIKSIKSMNIKKIIVWRAGGPGITVPEYSWEPLDEVLSKLVERPDYKNILEFGLWVKPGVGWRCGRGQNTPCLPKFIGSGKGKVEVEKGQIFVALPEGY